MAQVIGQGTGRHAEGEENDDGWSAVVLIAAVASALSCEVMLFFF